MPLEKHSGLEGVEAAATRLSRVDGEAGKLILAGYAVEEIAPRASFEEMAYLLWHGSLPNASELKDMAVDLASRRCLPPVTLALLRMAAGTLSLGHAESPEEQARTLVASFPSIVGAYQRLSSGQEPLKPRADLSHAQYCLHQMFGGEVGKERARGLETYLNTVCDHGLNASTFAARVIVST